MKNHIITVIILIFCAFQAYTQGMIFTENITATKAHLGQFGSGTLQIDDAGNDGLITKPLIVAEGFDTGLQGVENEFGENNINSFIRGVNDPNSFNLEQLITGGTNEIFGDQDYDIIYVNWDNPRDYLERNAFVLEQVITWVNDQKVASGSTEQNVILGQSMGGIIARYALVDKF